MRDLIRFLVTCGGIEGFCCVHIRGDGYFTICPFGFVVKLIAFNFDVFQEKETSTSRRVGGI